MKKLMLIIGFLGLLTGCSTIAGWFERHETLQVQQPVEKKDGGPRRITKKSLEEESMLGEQSGSLWVGRGQASYLFTNNTQRMIGDLLNVRIEGYPKDQIQTKVNVISKLVAEILNEQKEELKQKQEDLKKMNPREAAPVPARGLASAPTEAAAAASAPAETVVPNEIVPEDGGPQLDAKALLSKNEKELRKIDAEEEEIKNLAKAKEFAVRQVPTRITEIMKDGNYRIRGEQPFMIGKREYKLLVMGTVRAEDYDDKGISAEVISDPVFDIISDKKSEAL